MRQSNSTTIKVKTGCTPAYVTCIEGDDGNLKQISISMGKGGGCARSISCAFTDLCNTIIRIGGSIDDIINSLAEHDCHKRRCCSNQIANALREWRDRNAEDSKGD